MASRKRQLRAHEPENITVHNRMATVRDSARAADLFAEMLRAVRNQKRINGARRHDEPESDSPAQLH